jgi:excisionase family DNA binding protein
MATKATRERRKGPKETQATRWLPLREACRLLGVNESTLRRWADAGYVRCFRTLGGHRRFAEEDLRALIEGRVSQGETPAQELGQLALSRIRRRLQRGKARTAEWYLQLPGEAREALKPLGRRLVEILGQYMSNKAQADRLVREGREIGVQYARQLKETGLSIKGALEALVFFRKGLEDAAADLAHRHGLRGEEVAQLWDFVSNLSDQVLLAVGEAYSD